MQRLTKIDLSKFYFGAFAMTDLGGIPCFVTRTGYTGEDGFEISVPNEKAVSLTEQLMSAGGVHLAGASSSQLLLPVVLHTALTRRTRGRARRARQPAPGGGSVPVRQRPDGGHHARGGGSGLDRGCAKLA